MRRLGHGAAFEQLMDGLAEATNGGPLANSKPRWLSVRRQPRFDAGAALRGPAEQQIPRAQAQELRQQQADADQRAPDFLGEQVAHSAFEIGRNAGSGAALFLGVLRLNPRRFGVGPEREEFFCRPYSARRRSTLRTLIGEPVWQSFWVRTALVPSYNLRDDSNS
jgi:hypothetical protein